MNDSPAYALLRAVLTANGVTPHIVSHPTSHLSGRFRIAQLPLAIRPLAFTVMCAPLSGRVVAQVRPGQSPPLPVGSPAV